MKSLTVNFKLFAILTVVFICMTAIGTVTHELGHYFVAKYFKYKTTLHYGCVTSYNEKQQQYFLKVHSKYNTEIKNNKAFPGRATYKKEVKKMQKEYFLIALGGPLQTIITGTIGFVLFILFRKKHITINRVALIGWIYIFLSLFWLRQTANFVMGIALKVLFNKNNIRSDETTLAYFLNLPNWSIDYTTGIIGGIILFVVIYLIPKETRFTFMLSGLTGGFLGFYLWLEKFGKYILP